MQNFIFEDLKELLKMNRIMVDGKLLKIKIIELLHLDHFFNGKLLDDTIKKGNFPKG